MTHPYIVLLARQTLCMNNANIIKHDSIPKMTACIPLMTLRKYIIFNLAKLNNPSKKV